MNKLCMEIHFFIQVPSWVEEGKESLSLQTHFSFQCLWSPEVQRISRLAAQKSAQDHKMDDWMERLKREGDAKQKHQIKRHWNEKYDYSVCVCVQAGWSSHSRHPSQCVLEASVVAVWGSVVHGQVYVVVMRVDRRVVVVVMVVVVVIVQGGQVL